MISIVIAILIVILIVIVDVVGDVNGDVNGDEALRWRLTPPTERICMRHDLHASS